MRPVCDLPPVDDRHAHGQIASGLDLDIAVPSREHLRLQHPGDGAGVVKRATVAAVFFLVEPFVEFQHIRHRNSSLRPDGADCCGARRRCHGLVRDIERHHRDRDAGGEHFGRGLRVDIDVEFGGWRDVATLEIAASHHHDPADPLCNVRGLAQRHGNVGQGANRRDGHAAAFLGPDGVDQEIDGMPVLKRGRRGRQDRAVEAGTAMYMLSCHEASRQRLLCAGKDGHVGTAGKVADLARILLRQGQRYIAGNGCDPQHIEFRAGKGKQHGHRVVLPRIRIDNQLLLRCHDLSAR